jgi:hypothetical protein
MTRMRFSFRSGPDQLCTSIRGSNPRDPDLNVFWVHDTSAGCEKTYRLIDSTAPLAERLIRLARVPGLRSLTRRLLRVADDVLY